jgi:hypothetical protein
VTAHVIPFPPRGPFAVYVVDDADGWLVLCRKHAWLHSDQREAIRDAEFVASTHGVAVEVKA